STLRQLALALTIPAGPFALARIAHLATARSLLSHLERTSAEMDAPRSSAFDSLPRRIAPMIGNLDARWLAATVCSDGKSRVDVEQTNDQGAGCVACG
ncbi:MAG: hypothetical protein ACRD1H_15095, partial [Vicinamibacterales bacterium]